MNHIEWFEILAPTFSSTALCLCALWLARNVITTRLTKSVQHDFDQKIELVRSQFRNSEELLKADLRTKEGEIALLRNSAIAGLTSRQAAIDKRRLEAVDQIWSAVITISKYRTAAAYIASINFEKALASAAQDSKVREVFGQLSSVFESSISTDHEAMKARPYISDLVWALFSAYEATIYGAIAKIFALKQGFSVDILKTDHTVDMIKVALPHHIEYIEKFGSSVGEYLLDELQSTLLNELKKTLEGKEDDKESIARAAAIMEESKRVTEQIAAVRDARH